MPGAEASVPDPRRVSGAAAEDAAARALQAAGWTILARNLRTRSGEIDLLALRQGRIRVVEVKARRVGGSAGTGADALTATKMRRVARVAEEVLRMRGLASVPREFVGAVVDLDADGRPGDVRLVPVEEIP